LLYFAKEEEMELPKKLTKKNLLVTAVVLICLLVGVDVAVLEDSKVKAGLNKAQDIVGGLLGGDEAPAEETPADKAEEAEAPKAE
jgi:hypothetical protein